MTFAFRIKVALFSISFATCATLVHAQGESPTASELKVLPPYCQARLKGDAASKKSWAQQFPGDTFTHVHHYCYALNFMSKARFESDKRKKKYYLQRAQGNFDYVIRAWPASFHLTAQAKAYRAQVQAMLSAP